MANVRRHFPPQVHGRARVSRTALVDVAPREGMDLPPPTRVGEGSTVGAFSIIYRSAQVLRGVSVGDRCVVGPAAVLRDGAVLGHGCYVGAEAMIGKGAVLGDGSIVGPGCGVGTGAHMGRGTKVLDQPRLPRDTAGDAPSTVGSKARVGDGTVVCGRVTVGRGATVAAGEVVEDDVPDGALWSGGRVAAGSGDQGRGPVPPV